MSRLAGSPPAFRTRFLFPEDGPAYSVVAAIEWNCPPGALDEVSHAIAGAFRSAPRETLIASLVRLKLVTRGRDAGSDDGRDAEIAAWLDLLCCHPGDIAIEVLRSWPMNPRGMFWPTWHDIEKELRRLTDKRRALLNFVLDLQRRGSAPAIPLAPETPEQREAAVRRWEEEIRPQLAEPARPSGPIETNEEALARLSGKTVEEVRVLLAATPDIASARRSAA